MMQAACNCNKLVLQILIIARITNSGPIPEYVYVNDPKSWVEADAYCLSEYQSNLASIHNTQENTAVYNIRQSSCWIGYSDTKSEGTFVTADGTPHDYSQTWCAGSPHGDADDCVAMGSTVAGCWFDNICTNKYTFVCNPIGSALTNYPTNYPTSITNYPTSITNYPTSITNYPTSITNTPTVITNYPTAITKSPTLPPTAITNNPTRNPTRDDDDGKASSSGDSSSSDGNLFGAHEQDSMKLNNNEQKRLISIQFNNDISWILWMILIAFILGIVGWYFCCYFGRNMNDKKQYVVNEESDRV